MADTESDTERNRTRTIHFRDRAVYLPAADALVLADLHLGRDTTSNVELPLGEPEELPDRLAALVAHFDPAEVVFAGDVLHAFSRVPEGIEDTLSTLHTIVDDAGGCLTIVRGNHDTMLETVTAIEPVEARRLPDGETTVIHGHEIPEESAARYVIGHDHPAVVIEGRRLPCYLLGEASYQDGDVLVLPAFNRLAAGTVINRMADEDFQSPLLTGVDAFRPIVRDESADETLVFPPLERFRELL